VHHRMRLTLSADHRIIDGAPAAQFLQALTSIPETPAAVLTSSEQKALLVVGGQDVLVRRPGSTRPTRGGTASERTPQVAAMPPTLW
jgi:hypothetical protein